MSRWDRMKRYWSEPLDDQVVILLGIILIVIYFIVRLHE